MAVDEDIPGARRVIERITTRFNIYFLCTMSLLGAILFFVGLFQCNETSSITLDNLSEPGGMAGVGMMRFALFFPWFTALYFARHFLATVKHLERENEELHAKIAALSKSTRE